MGKKSYLLHGSADEVGEKLQESYDRILDSTRKWAEIISFDPDPQTGMTPKDVVWHKNKSKLYRYCSNNISMTLTSFARDIFSKLTLVMSSRNNCLWYYTSTAFNYCNITEFIII